MKKVKIYFMMIKIFLDFLIIFATFFLSRELRLITDSLPSIKLPIQTIATPQLFEFWVLWAGILVIIFFIHWLYKFDSTWWRIKEFSSIFIYSFYSFVFFTVTVYLWKWFIFEVEIPRLIIWYTFLLWSFFLIFERFTISLFSKFLYRKWLLPRSRILIIWNINNKESYDLITSFVKSYEYNVVGISKWIKNDFWWIHRYWYENIKELIKDRQLDELLVINSYYNEQRNNELWELVRIFWIKYRYIANSFDLAKSNTVMSLVNDIPALEIKNTTLSEWSIVMKRLFDLFAWIFWIILFLPLIIIVAILIKIEDPKWPIIFKNRRVWKLWKEFDLYKFRYMKWEYCTKDSYNVSADEKKKAQEYEQELIKNQSTRFWPLYKIKNDPRKTRIWAFIEKYSIDELPQFFNLIIWNMSLIWPRPHQAREVNKYQLEHIRLLTIKPWITWMSQVNWREKNTFDDEANLDIYYIENWNVLLDLKILIKTLYVVLTRK